MKAFYKRVDGIAVSSGWASCGHALFMNIRTGIL